MGAGTGTGDRREQPHGGHLSVYKSRNPYQPFKEEGQKPYFVRRSGFTVRRLVFAITAGVVGFGLMWSALELFA